MKYSGVRIVSVIFVALIWGGITARPALAQNQDPDSFGNKVKFAGLFSTGEVFLDPSPTATPAPPGNFLVHLDPQPATTNFDVQDIGQIVIPKNTATTIFYFNPVLLDHYGLHNETATAGQGNIQFDYYFTFENAALNDPSVIDPNTGLPANGKLVDIDFNFSFLRSRSLQPNENDIQTLYYGRPSLGAINRQFFVTRGIPNHVINQVFKHDTTIRVHLRGFATFIDSASTSIGFRVFTD
jgi:hypothetical protein